MSGIEKPEGRSQLRVEKPPDIAEKYYAEVLKPRLERGELITLAGDDMKVYFGQDYDPERSDLYAQATYLLVERVLKSSFKKELVFLGGGPGAGKTEMVGSAIVKSGYNEILYDTTFSSFPGIEHLVQIAREHNIAVRMYGILANLEYARAHTILREHATGREVTAAAFSRGHSGFVETVRETLERGLLSADEVRLFDLRKVTTAEEIIRKVAESDWEKDPLSSISAINYNKNELENMYEKKYFNPRTGQRL